MSARVLVVVSGGVADAYAEGAQVEIVDLDNVEAGDGPVSLPGSFRALARRAGLRASGDCASIRYDGAESPELGTYSVSVDYRTRGGDCKTWRGMVYLAADATDALRMASARIERRNTTLKIDGGTAGPIRGRE